jgi:UDP-N-acetylmuramoyl-tripeptide--D-alanyl-D-alanine ligase
MRRTVGEIAALLSVPLIGSAAVQVSGVAIDSRAVVRGDLFVALPGERVDGHDFIPQAAQRGAAAALVRRPGDVPLPQLVARDTAAALQQLAGAERAAASYRLVGITGSLGKTTTKEFLAALLATRFRVGSTRGSRNSQVGLPAELCSQPPGLEWMVAELGMNHAGELDRLGAMVRPDVLVYTCVAPVHLEFFPDVDAIAEAKAELIPHLRPEGLLVLNLADPRVARMAGRFAGRTVGYGVADASDLWLSDFTSRGLLGATFRLRGPAGDVAIDWPIAGRHQADNFLAAAACALALGVPAANLPACAAALRPARRRGEVHPLPGGGWLVDDSYNASPEAMRRLLELLAETPGRRLAVLGEMLELGATTLALHRDVGERAGAVADVLVVVGAEAAGALAEAASGDHVHHVADAEAALALVRGLLRPGDVVLVKGSRGIGLERVVDGLLAGEA